MSPELRPLGDAGWLIDLASAQQRRQVAAVLAKADLAGPSSGLEVVAGERTLAVLFTTTPPSRELAGERARLRERLSRLLDRPAAADAGTPEERGSVVTIEVVYDGPDLDRVADLLGMDVAALVDWHTGQDWTVAFTGFMPGFGYLTADDPRTVPRLPDPRPRIAPGSVGLAGQYSGIYPQASPGGWQLIGRTDAPLWRVERTPPALLVTDARVRFVAVGR